MVDYLLVTLLYGGEVKNPRQSAQSAFAKNTFFDILVYTKKVYLCGSKLKFKVMALAIKSPPVLTGKAAREFYKRWAAATESKSKEEVQESFRRSKAYFKEQKVFDYED